jgi:hypothetical protein
MLASALGLLSLGLPWEQIPGLPGVVIPGVVVVFPSDDLGAGGVSYLPGVFFPSFPGGVVLGTGHTMRVTGLVAALLLARAIRRQSRATAWLAIAIGALALPLGVNQGAIMPGRVAYLAALLTAAASVGLLPIPRPGAPGTAAAHPPIPPQARPPNQHP